MSAYRLKLSDGTTTIDLLGGNAKVLDGGLEMIPPRVRSNYNESTFANGGKLTSAHYDNRIITIRLRIARDSLANLKTTIRQIHRLLNDAQERTLLGFGSQVYLEYQWGDTDAQSTYFDVYRGDLAMPRDYLSVVLANSYTVLNAVLTLECKPFGRYTNQDIAQDTLENSQSALALQTNYQTQDGSGTEIDTALEWEGQTFTPGSDYTATKAALKLARTGSPGTVTCAIYATAAGLPTGAALASGTYDCDAINEHQGGWDNAEWVTFDLGAGVALTNGTVYAIVWYGASVAIANSFRNRWDSAAGYAGGQRVTSADGGSSWAASAAQDYNFALFSAETNANYQDVTTSESYGDVPARMYHKLALTGATGSTKMWIAKRSGTRQSDDLWIEGEGESSSTNVAAADRRIHSDIPLADISGGAYRQFNIYHSAPIAADTSIARVNYTIATVPRGQFRVLLRARVVCDDVADYDHLAFGYGYSYGGKTKAPSDASGEYYTCAAHNTWEILDLGEILLPPLPESDIASNASLELRLFLYSQDTLTATENYKWQWDYIFLLPIDEGVAIVDSVATTDNLAIDGITDPPNVFKLSTNTINAYPDKTGAPFTLGREDTRIYVLRNDAKTVTFASDVKYQPQFLVI